MAEAVQKLLDFLIKFEQQSVFVPFGFRPIDRSIDLQSIANSPWSQSIPCLSLSLPLASLTPDQTMLAEVIRLWQRAQVSLGCMVKS